MTMLMMMLRWPHHKRCTGVARWPPCPTPSTWYARVSTIPPPSTLLLTTSTSPTLQFKLQVTAATLLLATLLLCFFAGGLRYTLIEPEGDVGVAPPMELRVPRGLGNLLLSAKFLPLALLGMFLMYQGTQQYVHLCCLCCPTSSCLHDSPTRPGCWLQEPRQLPPPSNRGNVLALPGSCPQSTSHAWLAMLSAAGPSGPLQTPPSSQVPHPRLRPRSSALRRVRRHKTRHSVRCLPRWTRCTASSPRRRWMKQWPSCAPRQPRRYGNKGVTDASLATRVVTRLTTIVRFLAAKRRVNERSACGERHVPSMANACCATLRSRGTCRVPTRPNS